MASGDLIRLSKCEACEAEVKIKEDKNGLAYYICRHEHADGTFCRRRVWFSAMETRRLREDVALQQEKPKPPQPAPAEKRDVATDDADDWSI